MTTTVINRKDTAWWGNGPIPHPDYVYIGRPSKWGNPFIIDDEVGRAKAVAKYRDWLLSQLEAPEYVGQGLWWADIAELKDKILVCWCKPLACHGDVLAELADQEAPR